MRTRLAIPTGGVVDQAPHADRPSSTNPPGFCSNVVPHTSANGRRVLAQRPGLSLAFAGYSPRFALPVNGMGVVGRSLSVQQGWDAPVTIQGAGAVTIAPGGTGSVTQAVPTGKAATVVSLDGARLQYFADASYASAVGRCAFGRKAAANGGTDWTGGSLIVGGWSSKVEKAYGGAVGNKVISRVHCYKAATSGSEPLTLDFTVEVEDKEPGEAVASGAQAIQAEACVLVGPYLLVAAGKYLYCFDARPSASVVGDRYLARTSFAGWSWTVEDVSAWATAPVPQADGTVLAARGFAFVAYRGDPTIGGFVTQDDRLQGSYIRSAVAQVRLDFPATDTSISPLRPLLVGDASYFRYGPTPYPHEEQQADWRPAEWIDGKGRAIICLESVGPFQSQGLETLSDTIAWTGRMLLGTTNDGFAEPGDPDGSAGYWNFLTVEWPSALGENRFPTYTKEDVSSRKPNWLGSGWYNDIPYAVDGSILNNTGVGPKSSLACIRAAETGIWLAGSFADGSHVRGRPRFVSSGVSRYPEQWTKNLGTHIGRGALAAEAWPQQGVNHVLAVGTRNNTWEGSSSKQASAWMLNARNGQLLWTMDFGSGVSARNAAFIRVGDRSLAIITHQIT